MPKNKENELTITEKKKRGRPRKDNGDKEVISPVKRGRGRPRKITTEQAQPVIKRGRGRPRKEVRDCPVKPKNPVGRPRKTPKEKTLNTIPTSIVLNPRSVYENKTTVNSCEPKKELVLTSSNKYVEIIPDAGESCSLDKFADSLNVLKGHHDVFGTYSFDFQEIEDELTYLKQDYNLENAFYNSSENTFYSIKDAYTDEQNFALSVLTDYFRDRLAPRCTFEDWVSFRKALSRSVKDTVAVELRVYHNSKTDTDRVYFIHSVDWDEVERQLMPILETIDLLPKELAHEVNY